MYEQRRKHLQLGLVWKDLRLLVRISDKISVFLLVKSYLQLFAFKCLPVCVCVYAVQANKGNVRRVPVICNSEIARPTFYIIYVCDDEFMYIAGFVLSVFFLTICLASHSITKNSSPGGPGSAKPTFFFVGCKIPSHQKKNTHFPLILEISPKITLQIFKKVRKNVVQN